MYQIRTEQVEFVIQSDKLTHQFVLHLAVHLFIVPFVAVTRLAVYAHVWCSVLLFRLNTCLACRRFDSCHVNIHWPDAHLNVGLRYPEIRQTVVIKPGVMMEKIFNVSLLGL
jgi:hypothetical protein